MKKVLFLFAAFLFLCQGAQAGNKIKYYFNKPVDTTVAAGVSAAYLNNCIADTLAAYLGRARYSLDICIYDFEKTFSYNIATLDTVFAPEVAAAIDSAYARGVKVRIIYDSSNANTGLTLLDTAIHTMGSPQGPDYTIMHNKFVIIDAASPYPNDPIVWTGCLNWYYEQWNWDYNNVVVLQDSALANAYTAEFNMMWGDTGINKNWANSKFGQFKTDLGHHTFTIEGNLVELYFSPSDGTDSHIQSTIASANTDLYFGEYTFTEHTDANDIVAKYNAGVNVYGIDDSYSSGYYPTGQFDTYLGTHFKQYTESADTLYHNKFLIVDPSDTCSDPMVLTGSHNWSVSANNQNDENTIIIHNDTAANVFLQYFKASFNNLGGTITLPAYGCHTAGVPVRNTIAGSTAIYPNPSANDFTITYQLTTLQNVSVDIYDLTGQKMASLVTDQQQAPGSHSFSYTIGIPGIYFVKVAAGNERFTKKVVITK